MKKIYTAVVVGCGNIGALMEREPRRPKPATHAGALSANKRTRLVALVDTDKKNLSAAGKLFPTAHRYTNLKECLAKESPDIVVVATPPQTHLSLTRTCLEENVPIAICEKPLAQNIKDAREIARLVKDSNTLFVVNYQRRFYPLIAQIRNEIKKGKIGRISQISCFYSNGLYNNGGHLIDTVLYLTQDPIVTAHGARNTHNRTHPKGDLNVDALLRTAGGATVTLQSFDQDTYGASEVRIFGEKGAYFIREYGFTVVRVLPRPSVFKGVRQLDYIGARTTTKVESAVAGVLNEAITAYEGKKKSHSNAATATEVVEVLDLIARSTKK